MPDEVTAADLWSSIAALASEVPIEVWRHHRNIVRDYINSIEKERDKAKRALDYIATDATIVPEGCPEPWRSIIIDWAKVADEASKEAAPPIPQTRRRKPRAGIFASDNPNLSEELRKWRRGDIKD